MMYVIVIIHPNKSYMCILVFALHLCVCVCVYLNGNYVIIVFSELAVSQHILKVVVRQALLDFISLETNEIRQCVLQDASVEGNERE